MRQPLPLWMRILLGLGLGAVAVLVWLYLARGGTGLRCVFFELTGLYCPGCGSGRAVTALLRGEWGRAFLYNPLLFVLGPPALCVFLYEYVRLLFPRLRLRAIRVPRPVEIGCVALVLAFWILRNIPAFSFLAPV